MSTPTNQTTTRILAAFMSLLKENGLEGTTTRRLAREAQVNEVTIFRHFGDKQNLIRQAFHHFNPANHIQAYQPSFDPSNSTAAARALLDTMLFLRKLLIEHPEFWQYSLAEYNHFPQLKAEFEAAPQAAKALLERVIRQANPVLRPGVAPEQAALNLLASIFTTVVWHSRQWLTLSEIDWQLTFLGAIRAIIDFSNQAVLALESQNKQENEQDKEKKES